MHDIQPPSRRVFRRKRVHMGNAIITDLESKVSDLEEGKRFDRGLYCRECGRWRKWSETFIEWRKHGINWTRYWFCNKCGNQLKEDEL